MGTKYPGTAEERRVLEAYIKLRRAVNAIASRGSGAMRAANLTESQFGVLEALHHLGPLCQKDLASKVLRSAGNLTTVLDNLEHRRLVERQRSREDRRIVMVCLTEDGQNLIRSALPGHVASLVDAFSVLSADEQEQLAALCLRLGTQDVDITENPRQSVRRGPAG